MARNIGFIGVGFMGHGMAKNSQKLRPREESATSRRAMRGASARRPSR